jgi:acyl-coenzyme A thioesterase PaaI-like protein
MRKLFPTNLSESKKSRWLRRVFNFWPCIWCTGSKVTFIAGNWQELHVELSLNWRTRNRVGTVYGGSIYSSIDPYYMLLLMEILGKDFVVWDKAASFKFVRPITGKVKCRFLIADSDIANVKQTIAEKSEFTFDFPLKFEDDEGNVYAIFTKSIYVANKQFYKEKLAKRKQ